MIVTDIGGVQTRIATKEELDMIGSIRFRSYFSNDSVSEAAGPVFLDAYDGYANSVNHIAYLKGEPIGAIRGCTYKGRNDKIPALEVYREEIEKEVGLDAKLFESCRFVILPEVKKVFHATLSLIKTSCVLSYAMGCDHSITAVRPKHISFYEKMGFTVCSAPKLYPGLKAEMVLLIAKDSRPQMDDYGVTFKLLKQTQEDRENYLACLAKLH